MTEEKHEIQLENMQKIQSKHNSLKLIVLVTLMLQTSTLTLSMSYATSRPGDMFIMSTSVFMVEQLKFVVCLMMVYWTESLSWKHFISIIDKTIIKQPKDTLKVCIPSLVYVIQNNLMYVATSNLDAATCHITLQLKIFTTAMFTVLILKRKIFRNQWVALLLLIIGVILVQLNNSIDKTQKIHPEQNRWIGLICAIVICFLSGFAGVYFEKILKEAEISLWMRNIQLSFVSIPLGFIVSLKDWTIIFDKGFFYGYDLYIVYLICLQAAGGLIVSMVVKYADNILKGFATSLSIIVTCVFLIHFFCFTITVQFVLGTLLVIISTCVYNYTSNNSKENMSPNICIDQKV